MAQPRIFNSTAMRELCNVVQRIAPCDAPVLLTGETGTGKEIVAEMIHQHSPRSAREMVSINTAALPRELVEAELFGTTKGAYTGSTGSRMGLIQSADKSTLFLDELSEMPTDLQSKLLRVLQDGRVRPVGGTATIPVDIRVIAACNQPADDLIQDGKLREDLYYRISTVHFDIPPLRERETDILPMADAFLAFYAAETNQEPKVLTEEARKALEAYSWPGNVRQLVNEMQRLTIMVPETEITVGHLKTVDQKLKFRAKGLAEVERAAIVKALKAAVGNKLEASRILGIGRQTLYSKLRRYEIQEQEYYDNGIIPAARRRKVKPKVPISLVEDDDDDQPPQPEQPLQGIISRGGTS